jgi:hypothetical protein
MLWLALIPRVWRQGGDKRTEKFKTTATSEIVNETAIGVIAARSLEYRLSGRSIWSAGAYYIQGAEEGDYAAYVAARSGFSIGNMYKVRETIQ